MKIIDEKGRLFGKINVIDFLIILFLFCLALMFYFGFKIFTKKTNDFVLKKEIIDVELDCRFIKLKPEVSKSISVGDKELDENNKVIGEILSFGDVVPYLYEFNLGEKENIINKDSNLKLIHVRLKLIAEVRGNSLFYKDKLILVNEPLEFRTGKYAVIAIPEGKKIEKRVKLDLFVDLKSLDPDTIKLISLGDKELDENGDVVAEILKFCDTGNDTYEINLGGGNSFLGEDASKKKITVRMRLNCQIKEEDKKIYFKGKLVEDNSLIEFRTDKYAVRGKIVKTYITTAERPKERWVKLQVKFIGVDPKVAAVITPGDTEKRPDGLTVGRIESIPLNKLSDVLVVRENSFMMLNHPFLKDIIADLDFLCIEKEGVLYFKNYPVKMGNSITFSSDLYSISGTIIGLEMK